MLEIDNLHHSLVAQLLLFAMYQNHLNHSHSLVHSILIIDALLHIETVAITVIDAATIDDDDDYVDDDDLLLANFHDFDTNYDHETNDLLFHCDLF